MGKEKIDVSRRDFLKGAGISALSMAAVGSLAASGVAAAGPVETPTAGGSWRTPMPEVTDFAQEYTFDVVCVGHGYSGVTSCRELSEQGYKVAVIEVQPEESYMAMGNESCSINSKTLDRATAYNPVPHINMMDFYDNWMTIVGGQANPGLMMKFCKNNPETIDWYYDRLTDEDFSNIYHTGWPNEDENWEHVLPNIGPIRFWPGTFGCRGGCNQTVIQGYNRQAAIEAGAQFFFGTRGLYLIMDDGKVAGVVASNDSGYIKFNCKAAIVATGGFQDNKEMLVELMPDISHNMTDTDFWKDAFMGEKFAEGWSDEGYYRFGDGIKMAYWAGAHLETLIAGMNSKHIQPPSGMTNLPQAVWVRSDGKRFCNEFFPVVEQRGVVNVYMEREPVHCVFDDDFVLYRSFYVPQHGGMEPNASTLERLRSDMDTAYQKFQGTWEAPEGEGQGMPRGALDCICDDTLEGLAGQLGLTGPAVQAFVDQITRYNGYCDQGVDDEFGRHKEVLFPVKKAPFYAASGNPGYGEVMCTCGGIITDAEQNALDHNFKPIPGLYVSGNDCGRRFGLEYISPTPGVSLALAITLGRECGKSVAKFLA